MKHNFVVSLFGSFVGFGMLLVLLSVTGIVGASGADVRANVSRTNEVSSATPLTSTFTYQGQLKNGGNPITATCDFQFGLWDSLSGGTQLGITQTLSAVSVNAGYFTTFVNSGNSFGVNAFNGNQRWLAIAVRCPAGSGSYSAFNQRQQLTPAPYALFSAAPWVTNGSNLTYNTGNVGIGTTSPTSKLEIAAQDGLAITGFQPFLTLRDTNNANKRSVIQGADGKIIFYPDSFIGGAPAMVINNVSGNVGIGTTSPSSRLTVRGPDISGSTAAFRVENSAGISGLQVWDDGMVEIGTLADATTIHACYFDGSELLFAACNSAAEYVPTIDSSLGYPETADLVSIAPNIKNPYGDTHDPFTVQKSTTSCDTNLLGFIIKPELGADGKKLNDHYLPLAIYGYFPAKVTLENGVIKRGDPITSSSKPGYGMKATGACKIIGYALEDADHEGQIQVFANHGESTAPAVTSLQAQVKELQDQNASLAARLAALEQTPSGQTPAPSISSRDVMLFGVLLVAGIVVGRRTNLGGRS